jgi:SAM-dependent methyltransferase
MDFEYLKKIWTEEEQNFFQGWDFSHLNGRWEEQALPWDYEKIICGYLKSSDRLLDMGTGGGEFLLSLNHSYKLTCATEAYPPNVELCMEKLKPLGIDIRQIFNDREVPFEDNGFDLIINRHEAFESKEIYRLLKKDGIFITQQVGGENDRDLSEKLIEGFEPTFPNHNLNENIKKLRKSGFEILMKEEVFTKLEFYDIGALVYFAKIIEWEFPKFSVENCFDKLCKLHLELEEKGLVEGTEHRFLIVARKN